ncbi:MAG: radical SAM protein [Bacilli bacterium]
MRKDEYRVLMISINNVWRYGNIGLDQLTGYLRDKGFIVDINYFRKSDSAGEIFNTILKDYSFYGFSVNSSNYVKCCKIAKHIKKTVPKAVIVFGGGYTTRYYKEVFGETEDLDFITLGDGEVPTEFLLENLLINGNYRNEEVTNYMSIASRKDMNNKQPYLNTEITWFPSFDYYEKDTHIRNSRKVHCIQIKNNVCTGNCSFCTERHGNIFYKDISEVVRQVKYVHENFNVKKFYFTDDNILDPNNVIAKQHIKSLCEELKKLGYKLAFQCYIKAISLNDIKEDHELLELMRSVGFVEIFVGIESGNNEDLVLYNKHTTITDNYNIMKMITEHGITPIMGFIGFNPYSTLDKIKKNFLFLCNVKCTYLFNYLYTFVVINKYTSLYEMSKKDDLLLSSNEECINVKYTYKDKSVIPILKYVDEKMIPRLNSLDYELDWVTYSVLEHEIWYENIKDYRPMLEKYKNEDFEIIKTYLSILFIDNDLDRFKSVEDKFWAHFIEREKDLKMVYDYLISLHEKN